MHSVLAFEECSGSACLLLLANTQFDDWCLWLRLQEHIPQDSQRLLPGMVDAAELQDGYSAPMMNGVFC
jgi:hypothetical protein